ncbi:MAG: DsbA family protein [Myxococcota bacterium]
MAQQADNSTTRLLMMVVVAIVAFIGGWLVGNYNQKADGDTAKQGAASAVEGAKDLDDSSKIPVGDSPILGKESAVISVVEFSDFQCPFCNRGAETVKKLQEKYPNDVKVVFKHNPLAFHKQAPAAHKASMAARDVGGEDAFWKMHDKFFANQKAMKGKNGDAFLNWAAGFAKEIGLDEAKFKETYKKNEDKYQAVIDRDMELGKELAVRGTPHFFVNGERVKGAKGLPAFEAIVKEQLEEAKKMQQAGVKRSEIYEKMVADNFDGGADNAEQKKPQKKQTKVSMVPVESNDPVFGNEEDPLVTIVEFSDFQCPFCTKVVPTVDKIKENYSDKVRFVFKQYPLPMHQQAPMASEIALAAGEQGKFWEMHDLLFEKQSEMKGKNDQQMIEWGTGLAKQLGLNTGKFKKVLESDKFAEEVKKETQLASKVGARGTPNFWVNGVNVVGAQPYSKFKQVIDEQIKLAEKTKKSKNVSGDELYKAMVEINKKNAGAAAAAEKPTPKKPKPAEKVDEANLKIGDAPVKGPANAPVTIVEFSDFECPYCKRGTDNLEEAVSKFDGKVKIAFKHYPLPFHKAAKPAAKAAMAAGEQGKFWEMHDLLFDNQKQLKQDGLYEKLAKQLGLNMAKFKKDMQKPEYDKIIEQDMAQGQKVGVRGTPAFFINGKRLVGAQPPARFEQLIKEELDK